MTDRMDIPVELHSMSRWPAAVPVAGALEPIASHWNEALMTMSRFDIFRPSRRPPGGRVRAARDATLAPRGHAGLAPAPGSRITDSSAEA